MKTRTTLGILGLIAAIASLPACGSDRRGGGGGGGGDGGGDGAGGGDGGSGGPTIDEAQWDSPYAKIPAQLGSSVDAEETKVLPGRESSDPTDEHEDSTGGIADEDIVGDLAIAVMWGDRTYYRDGKYNDTEWTVTRGTVEGPDGPLPAYTIQAAATPAERFVASQTAFFYRFPEAAHWRVWELGGEIFKVVGDIAAEDVVVDGFTRLNGMSANDITEPTTLVVAPASLRITTFHELGEGAGGARVADSDVGRIVQVRYDLPGRPFDTRRDYTGGPSTHQNIYGQHRQFFRVTRPNGPGVVWQDRESGEPKVTWLSDTEPGTHSTDSLPWIDGTVLAAAASDPTGQIFYVLIVGGSGVPNDTRDAWLIKTDQGGSEIDRLEIDTSRDGGLNLVTFGTRQSTSNQAQLRWSDGQLGLMLARQMTQADDGLNHQGGIAAVFDDDTLQRIAYHGQTSGHSFSNVLGVDKNGAFLGIDLGDNYPRGVNLHRFDRNGISSRVVYTFKTAHGRSATNPAGRQFDRYDDISGDGADFYKWSNDNATYTELGGVAETSSGLSVVFASERSGLDNSRVGAALNDPRDLALVLTRRDFEGAARGEGPNVVTDDLLRSSGGPAVEGGFYDFGGGWQPQRNAGVVWLTDYPDTSQNASRVKVRRIDDNRLLILWEVWDPSMQLDTMAMVVSPSGDKLSPPTSLGRKVRLGRREELLTLGDGIAHIGGSGDAGQLIVTLIFPYAAPAPPEAPDEPAEPELPDGGAEGGPEAGPEAG